MLLTKQTSRNEGFTLIFFSLFQCITCIARCFARSFSTQPSVPDSIDGLFKLLKLCWLGKCLWWTIKFPATPPVSCFSCCAPACQKLSPSSVIADRSQAAVQELTGYWKGFCVTLNTLTVLRNSTRIIFVLLDVFWKTSNCTWLLKRSLSSWKCLILTALQKISTLWSLSCREGRGNKSHPIAEIYVLWLHFYWWSSSSFVLEFVGMSNICKGWHRASTLIFPPTCFLVLSCLFFFYVAQWRSTYFEGSDCKEIVCWF